MTRTLIWDAGPGEVRTGLMEDGALSEFRIIRPRRGAALLQRGALFTVRITKRLAGRQALVTFGGSEDAVLAPCPDLPEGARLVARMLRPPIPEPGRVKRARLTPVADAEVLSAPGWHTSDEPAALFLRSVAADVNSILCPEASTANAVTAIIGNAGPAVHIDAQSVEDADFDTLIEQAVSGEHAISGGALSIERTRAMTVIDVDGVGDPLAINLAAARRIPALLRLFDIGGPVGVDFISVASRANRLAIDGALAEASAPLGPHERTAVNGFGFCQIIRPRSGPSVPEILCGTSVGRLSVESIAEALLRQAARSSGTGPRRLTAPPSVIDAIRGWPDDMAALAARLGAPIDLVPDANANRYGHVHVDQR